MNDPEVSSTEQIPGYELEEVRIVSSHAELKALFHPLRSTLLELVLERAATVGELAAAVERPKGTVAYHVGQLVEVDMLKVVRTRKVRAIEERFYGRTARIFYVGAIQPEEVALIPNYLTTAAAESTPAHQADHLRALLRYAWIDEDHAREFWRRVMELAMEFSALPRTGNRAYGFVTGLYPTDHPRLPEPGPTARSTRR